MEDNTIIELYNRRDERAILETQTKYGAYCLSVALNIVGTREDAEECVNDTWLRVWNAIPPHVPTCLRAFLAKITRNLAYNRYRDQHSARRGGGEVTLALDELDECIADPSNPADEYRKQELGEAVNRFLKGLSRRDCDIFLCRYYFVYPTAEIAARHGLKEDYVRLILARTREKLKRYLEKHRLL